VERARAQARAALESVRDVAESLETTRQTQNSPAARAPGSLRKKRNENAENAPPPTHDYGARKSFHSGFE
jgi:hypothetical protein